MTIDDKIIDEKLQYYIHRKATKMSALSSDEIDKYVHLTDEEKLTSGLSLLLEQAKFT